MILKRSLQGGRIDPEPLIVFDDISTLAKALRIPNDVQPTAPSTRSSNSDALDIKDIVLPILEWDKLVRILTEVILLSVLGDGTNNVQVPCSHKPATCLLNQFQ